MDHDLSETLEMRSAARAVAKLILMLRSLGVPDDTTIKALIGSGVSLARNLPNHQAVGAYLGEVSAALSVDSSAEAKN